MVSEPHPRHFRFCVVLDGWELYALTRVLRQHLNEYLEPLPLALREPLEDCYRECELMSREWAAWRRRGSAEAPPAEAVPDVRWRATIERGGVGHLGRVRAQSEATSRGRHTVRPAEAQGRPLVIRSRRRHRLQGKHRRCAVIAAKEAAEIAQKHGLSLSDAAALAKLAESAEEAEELAGAVCGQGRRSAASSRPRCQGPRRQDRMKL